MTICKRFPGIFQLPQYPVLASKYDRFMPVLPEGSIEHSKIYCQLVIILITKACVTGEGLSTIVDYMPKHSSYIRKNTISRYFIPAVSSAIIKIGSRKASTTRRKYRRHENQLRTYRYTNYQGTCNWGRSLNSS